MHSVYCYLHFVIGILNCILLFAAEAAKIAEKRSRRIKNSLRRLKNAYYEIFKGSLKKCRHVDKHVIQKCQYFVDMFAIALFVNLLT